jgi:hypothetical protein
MDQFEGLYKEVAKMMVVCFFDFYDFLNVLFRKGIHKVCTDHLSPVTREIIHNRENTVRENVKDRQGQESKYPGKPINNIKTDGFHFLK